MEPRKPLQHHEIRIIKINRKAILDLIWKIFVELGDKIFQLPHNAYYGDKVCLDMHFDEQQCEIILVAYRKNYNINKESLIAYINNSAEEAVDSLFINPKNKQCYHSVQDGTFFNGGSNEEYKQSSWRKMFKNLGIRIRWLGKYEVRFIRLSQKAIHELLWEYFMETGDKAMDIPAGTDDVIYHMYTEGALYQLTLYVMNLNEASDKAFEDNRAYCIQNIPITIDSYFEECEKRQRYVSVVLSENNTDK